MKRVVIITGAARGIGKAVAMLFASVGYSAVIADRDADEGEKTASLIKAGGGVVLSLPTDVSDPQAVASMTSEVADRFGRIDILVNNAGFGIWKSPLDLSTDEWDLVLNTNLRGTFLCSREAAKVMKATGGGAIINIASTRAFMSEASSEAYAASKGGIVALTHAMAASFSPLGIRVNCISPGWIETGDYSSLRNKDHSQHFSGRVGKPDDIARAALFLAENDFINGENIIIDGGMTRKMIYEP